MKMQMNTGLENNRATYRYSQPCNLWCFYSHDVAFRCLPQLHSFWGFWIHSINFLPRIWFINFLSLNFWYHLHTAFCQVSTITSFCQVSFLTSVFLTRICWLEKWLTYIRLTYRSQFLVAGGNSSRSGAISGSKQKLRPVQHAKQDSPTYN